MGKAGKTIKKVVKEGSGYSTFKSVAGTAKDMIAPSMPEVPTAEAPKPVAPATAKTENVQQAKDNARRNASNRTGRSQSSILNPSEALADEEKDILG